MKSEAKEPGSSSKAESIQAPVESAKQVPAYELIGLDDQGDAFYIAELSQSFTREELQNPDLLALLALQGWKHVKKTEPNP